MATKNKQSEGVGKFIKKESVQEDHQVKIIFFYKLECCILTVTL
jgi:hypothetical protein